MKWESREELIQRIKEIGQSLIDNAEKIASDYKYNTSVVITCYPKMSEGEFPCIKVETEFLPEETIERFM